MEKKLNSGAFFKNDKGDNPNRPDYKGTYTDANGNDHWASAWVKKDKNGNTYLSFTTQVKEAKAEQVSAPTVSVSNSSDNSELPF